MTLYIGTYIDESEEHTIYKATLNSEGNMHISPFIAAGPCPSFMTLNTDKTMLYCVNELEQSKNGRCSSVVCLKKNQDGFFIKDSELSTKGDCACHVRLDEKRRLLFVTNYLGKSLYVYTLGADGSIEKECQSIIFSGSGTHPKRQESPHPHQSLTSPCDNFLYVTDLGCDCVYVFKITESQSPLELLHKVRAPEGVGPRHMAISSDEKYIYISGELSSSVIVLQINDNGNLNLVENYPVFNECEPYPRTSTSEILVFKRHVYMANRGDDSISIFKELGNGKLGFIENIPCRGKTPRHFTILPSFRDGKDCLFVANLDSDSITEFLVQRDSLLFVGEYKGIKSPSFISNIIDTS